MRIAVTGARGFIARNLLWRLKEQGFTDIIEISHDIDDEALRTSLREIDIVYHLAGVNRPPTADDFVAGNFGFTDRLCAALADVAPYARIIYSSSIQADLDNDYGRSKKDAENRLLEHSAKGRGKVTIFRLPNVFGKWSRPNYNSAIATFCHNIARGVPIAVHDPAAILKLVYIDDVCDCFMALLSTENDTEEYATCTPVYETSVGEVATLIESFSHSRSSLVTPPVGKGLIRALYSTYVSFLPPSSFSYEVPMYSDPRGTFSEMLKTPDCGQFSFFTAHPGITRGEHYHHSKTEKFLVIKGHAKFGFRQIETGEVHDIFTNGTKAEIVETVPGWTHNITNVGDDEMIVMLWANEIFDREKPDTIAMKVQA